MELHLHLSVAFRALDRKWGAPVDLDTSADVAGVAHLPAVVERPTATFSSEDFLRSVKRSRPTPYSRQDYRRRENLKRCDSFSNISISRFPSRSDLGSTTTLDSGVLDSGSSDSSELEDVVCKDCDDFRSTETLDSVLGKKKDRRILKQLKSSALSFVEKKRWKKLHP